MPVEPPDTIPNLLVRNIPRSLVMGIEEGLDAAARRAYGAALGMDEGHLPHVLGQLRHFQMNEAFHRALTAADARPTPLRGNSVITGRAGVFTVARFNIPTGFWINGRRSYMRQQLSVANQALEALVHGDLFAPYEPPSDAVAFFVACFSGSVKYHPESPMSIHVAVPNRDMRGWLFREDVREFVNRYEPARASQEDLAVPKLKTKINKKNTGGSGP